MASDVYRAAEPTVFDVDTIESHVSNAPFLILAYQRRGWTFVGVDLLPTPWWHRPWWHSTSYAVHVRLHFRRAR